MLLIPMVIAYLAIGLWLGYVLARQSVWAAALGCGVYFVLGPAGIYLLTLPYDGEYSWFLVAVISIPAAALSTIVTQWTAVKARVVPRRVVLAFDAISFFAVLFVASPVGTIVLNRVGYYDHIASNLEIVHEARGGRTVVLSVPRAYFESVAAKGGARDFSYWIGAGFPAMQPSRRTDHIDLPGFFLPIHLMPQQPGAFIGPTRDTSYEFATDKDRRPVDIGVPGLSAIRVYHPSTLTSQVLIAKADDPGTPLYVCNGSDKLRCRRQYSDSDPAPFAYFINMENLSQWSEVEARATALVRSFIKN